MWRRLRQWVHNLPLGGKSLLLFGGAVTLIILVALSLPWLRMNALVTEGELAASRSAVETFDALDPGVPPGQTTEVGEAHIVRLTLAQAETRAIADPLVAAALRRFRDDPSRQEFLGRAWSGADRIYRYLRAIREPTPEGAPGGELAGVVLLERESRGAALLLAVNTLYVLAAGTFVLALALILLFFLGDRLILAPVRSLKETAETVRAGKLATRSNIRTGDEFEELSEAFNLMLGGLEDSQRQLRAINAALDVKLNELTEANLALFEAARLKGEFLANVSHELRTPLNSIIGFAGLLKEMAEASPPPPDEPKLVAAHEKRLRYLSNINVAGRTLLEMIESLLQMAKLEAGRVEVQPETISIEQVCQGLVGLLEGIARGKGIVIRLEMAPDLPLIETDARKFQQIVFNLLSNAVKFTDPSAREDARKGNQPGLIIVRAEILAGAPPGADGERHVRVSVLDNGPGIAPEDQPKVFEKFRQLEGGHTRRHQGTGLGLAICKELAELLQGEIQLFSEVGRGSMFSLILPLRLDLERARESRLESRFRGALAGRRGWRDDAPADPRPAPAHPEDHAHAASPTPNPTPHPTPNPTPNPIPAPAPR